MKGKNYDENFNRFVLFERAYCRAVESKLNEKKT